MRNWITTLWKKIEVPYFGLVSSSWFPQLPNKKVIKLEVFYVVMSIASFFVFWGGANDGVRDQDFSAAYYILVTPFCIACILYVISIFGYTATNKVQEIYWKTQLFRWIDPNHKYQFEAYPDGKEKLERYKEMWELEYKTPVEWTVNNAPFFMLIRVVLILGGAGLGFLVGYYL